MTTTIVGELAMEQFGRSIGQFMAGGEILELIGDVGAGKTTLTKGLAVGMGIAEMVQSPTFTISRVYQSPNGLQLAHYDFYRLGEAGIMGDEIHEVMAYSDTVTIIEWAEAINHVLPEDRLIVKIIVTGENRRQVEMTPTGEVSRALLRRVEDAE